MQKTFYVHIVQYYLGLKQKYYNVDGTIQHCAKWSFNAHKDTLGYAYVSESKATEAKEADSQVAVIIG